MSIDAIKHIMATVFSAQNALRALAPEFKWAGMGNLLGDYGEYICTVNDQEKIFDLLNYVKKQNFNNSPRTFYYYDVFVFSSNNEKKGKQIINEYNLF